MGAVYSTVDAGMKQDLDDLRRAAKQRSDDTLWALELDIDNKMADLIGSDPKNVADEVKRVITAIIADWKPHLGI